MNSLLPSKNPALSKSKKPLAELRFFAQSDVRIKALQEMRTRLCAIEESFSVDNASQSASEIEVWAESMLPDGSWADIEYANNLAKDWAAVAHLKRLEALSRAWYQNPNPSRLALLQRGLDAWYVRDPRNSNWWWNDIGAPLLLGQILLRIKDVCDPMLITRAEPAFCRYESKGRHTGQNLVWTETVAMYHGILTDDPDRVTKAFILIGHETRTFFEEEGIQPDQSFFQHGNLLYSGGYGQGFAADVARLIMISDGTVYAWPLEKVDRFAQWLLDGSRWMVRGQTFEPGAIGREIARQGHSATSFIQGLRRMAKVPHSRQAETIAAAAIEPSSGQSMVRGNRHFWCSDLMVQHRADYYCSVRVPSPRVFNNDIACCGGEGRVGHHMADGATFLMRDGDEYRDIYEVWNWRQIPGTTAPQVTGDFAPEDLRLRGEKAFAGGASDEKVGCMAVDLTRSGLSARKAWFLFEDSMVALGAGICGTTGAPVRTTINQCLWRKAVWMTGQQEELPTGEFTLEPGTSFTHDGMNYQILDGMGTLRLGDQEGAWSDCGVGSTERNRKAVLNAGLDHGIDPSNASYAYAVKMGKTSNDPVVDCSIPWVILANHPDLQAVWHSSEERGHAVFYQAGEVSFPDGQQVAVDSPCVMLYRNEKGTAILTLAQPEHRAGKVTLRLQGSNQGKIAVKWPNGSQAGSSITVELETFSKND